MHCNCCSDQSYFDEGPQELCCVIMALPPHFRERFSGKPAPQTQALESFFFFGPPGAGKSYCANNCAAEMGGNGLILTPTIALKLEANAKGLVAETIQSAVLRGTLKYKIGSKRPGGRPRWTVPTFLICSEIFQWSKADMDRCIAMARDLGGGTRIIMDGDPYQHGAVCQNQASSSQAELLQRNAKRHYCTRKKCYCEPVIASAGLMKLMRAGKVTFLRKNYRLKNRDVLRVIDEFLKIGNPRVGRSDARGAIERMIERNYVPLEKMPDSPDVVRVTYTHKEILRHTTNYYKKMGIPYDVESALAVGCAATCTVTLRDSRGKYICYNGMPVTVVGFKKDAVTVSADPDGDDEDAVAAALLEGSGGDMKTFDVPRKVATNVRPIIPTFVQTSYFVQGKTLDRVCVILDGAIPLESLYVMATRSDNTIFTSSNIARFFSRLFSEPFSYDHAVLKTFWERCARNE